MLDESGPPKVSVQDIIRLHLARKRYPALIAIRLRLEKIADAPAALGELFARKPGNTAVCLRLEEARISR